MNTYKLARSLALPFYVYVNTLPLAHAAPSLTIDYEERTILRAGTSIDELCVDSVHITFDKPIQLISIQGHLVATSSYRSDRSLPLLSFDQSMTTLSFDASLSDICNSKLPFHSIKLTPGVKYLHGGPTESIEAPLFFDTNFTQDASGTPLAHLQQQGSYSRTPNPSSRQPAHTTRENFPAESSLSSEADQESATCSDSASDVHSSSPCLAFLEPTARIDHAGLNHAFLVVKAWEQTESLRSIYAPQSRKSLNLLPLDTTILEPRGPGSRQHHFSFPATIYVTRKAAIFAKRLFPLLQAIGVADLSRPDGDTPYSSWPDQSKHYLHPFGSHQGQDADIGYITVGRGNERQATIDLEANFWLLYSVLQNAGVDLIYTSFKSEFITYAQKALSLGLINPMTFSRFNSGLIQDDHLNHDTHFHVKVASTTLKGLPTDIFNPINDVFNCFIGLKNIHQPSEKNFCLPTR